MPAAPGPHRLTAQCPGRAPCSRKCCRSDRGPGWSVPDGLEICRRGPEAGAGWLTTSLSPARGFRPVGGTVMQREGQAVMTAQQALLAPPQATPGSGPTSTPVPIKKVSSALLPRALHGGVSSLVKISPARRCFLWRPLPLRRNFLA